MQIWSYRRGGHWSQVDLPDSPDGKYESEYFRMVGYEDFGIVLGTLDGLDVGNGGIEVWSNTSDGSYLVVINTTLRWDIVHTPALPDLLDFLVWLSPLLDVWIKTTEYGDRIYEEKLNELKRPKKEVDR